MDSKKKTKVQRIGSFIKKRLKPVYLLLFIIPVIYSLLWKNQKQIVPDDIKHSNYLSFSVRSSNPSRLSLVENESELATWNINSKGYKNLEFVGPFNINKGIKFKAENLYINDTISFLGINLFSNNKVFSLGNEIEKNITVNNARIAEKDGVLILIVEKSGTTLSINLKPPAEWGESEPFNAKKLIIALVFLFAFLAVFVFNPSAKYFILTVIIAVFVLMFCYFADIHLNSKVSLLTSSKIKNVEIFYNNSPFFSITKKYSSETISDVFSQPLNLETEKYLRFDLGDSLISLKQIKIKISSGVFGRTYNLSDLAQDKLIINDMVLVGNTYYVTGKDPYIKLCSTEFISNIDLLLFLENNIFLFITLAVFILLIGFSGLLGKKLNNLKLKPAYLTFLLIPVVYFLIDQHWVKKNIPQGYDYLYFSSKTTHPSVFTLYNGSDSLTSWIVDSPGFKYLQFKGHFNLRENFFIRITNLSKFDTVSLLSINLFHDDKTYSLFENNNSVCKISNASCTENSNNFNITVKKTGVPVMISLLPSNLLEKNNQENRSRAIIILIVFFTFILILIFSPDQRFFIVSSLITTIMMVMFFWLTNDVQSQLTLSTDSSLKRVDFFYNFNPNFEQKRTYLDNASKTLYKFQIYLSEFSFYRVDIGEDNESVKNINISARSGVLRTNFDYSTISSENILLNDLKRYGNEYKVCGKDPFIALSSAYQVNKMHSTFLIRQNLFFFLSILLLIILVILSRLYIKEKLPNFFLVVFFLVFIFIGLVIHLFNSENIILLSEKRCTAPLPVFQTDSTQVYTNDLNNYILDQLPGRKNIIRMNNLVQYSVFRQLINNPVIHFGRDGWMFFTGGPARDNYENRQPLTLAELKKLRQVLEDRNEWLKKRGIHFYMVFPPMAQTVYEEYVGSRMRRHYKQTKSEQLLEYLKLNSDLDIIDIYNPIIKAKDTSSHELYFRNNCHWNFFGGYVAYYTMINYIKRDFPNIGEPLDSKDFKWVETKDYAPDLLKLMDLDMFYTSKEYSPSFNDNIVTDTIYPFYLDLWTPAPPAIVKTKRTSYPTMLMYGDSYAGGIIQFLFCNFSRSVFIWTPLFQPQIIEKEKPDMVIQEMVDMSINALLIKNKPFPELKDTVSNLPN